jgi:phage tail sheath protein FI
MPETFLHGAEVVEINDGPRPIRTVRSGIIGVVGTAPDSQDEVKATLTTGVVADDNALTWTAKGTGELGNKVSIKVVDPAAASQSLTVTVDTHYILVSLATNGSSVITTTADLLKTAIAANTEANALVEVADTAGSDGSGLMTAFRRAYLTGGIDEAFPLNTPVLIAGDQVKAGLLGETGSLPAAMEDIFDQTGAVIIVVRVAVGVDEDATLANVAGGINGADYEGAWALLGAESKTGFCPRILIAPSWTHQRPDSLANPVATELDSIAQRLRAIVVKDGTNTNDDDAIEDRGDYGSKRMYIVDPGVKVRNSLGELESRPASARVAGMIAKSDNERGFWWSPSNRTMNGIVGTERDVDFVLGDANSRANLLNEQEVATIIRADGFRLWGNRTCSDDPKWAFLSVVRTADMINDSILRAHMWAVDRNITRTYLEDVAKGVNDYLSRLKAMGAILGGRCFPSPGLNTPSSISDGKVFFDFEFTPPYPAEHITFRSKLVNDFIEEIL